MGCRLGSQASQRCICRLRYAHAASENRARPTVVFGDGQLAPHVGGVTGLLTSWCGANKVVNPQTPITPSPYAATHTSAATTTRPHAVYPHATQVFTRFVEIGRVVLINSGENKGKIAVIVDVVDANRVRGYTNQPRAPLSFSRALVSHTAHAHARLSPRSRRCRSSRT